MLRPGGGSGCLGTAQHCRGMTNWPNTIQCLRQDDLMSLGTKSFATEGIHDKVHDKVHDEVRDKVHEKVHDKRSWYQDPGTKISGEGVLQRFWYQDLWGNGSCMMGELPPRQTLTDILSLL